MRCRQERFPEGQSLGLSSKEVISQRTGIADDAEGHVVDYFAQVSIPPSGYHAHPFVIPRLMGSWINPGKSEYLFYRMESFGSLQALQGTGQQFLHLHLVWR